MAFIKGKHRICQSTIADFNIEQISGSPFYKRYGEFIRVFQKNYPQLDANILLAQPVEDPSKGVIEWFVPTDLEDPESLESMKTTAPDDFYHYSLLRDNAVAELKQGLSMIKSPQERSYIDCVLKFSDSEYSDSMFYGYGDYIIFGIWGMAIRKGRSPQTVITVDVQDHRVHTVSYEVQGKGTLIGRTTFLRKHGHKLQGSKDIPEVIAEHGYSFMSWLPDAPHGKPVIEDITYTAVCKRTSKLAINFIASLGGRFDGPTTINKDVGEMLSPSEFPRPVCDEGYEFVGWQNAPTAPIEMTDDMQFNAIFRPLSVTPPPPPQPDPKYLVSFDAGENGILQEGIEPVEVDPGVILPGMPLIAPKKGFEFIGWDRPVNEPIYEDTVFHALYKPIPLPWYKRFWLWLCGLFAGKGCLKALLGFLLLLVLLCLLLFFLRGCTSCLGHHRVPFISGPHEEVNGVVPVDSVDTSEGGVIDDNGYTQPITGEDGVLPTDQAVVPPARGEDGELPPTTTPEEGGPTIVSNRLVLFLTDKNENLDKFARDFKAAYPGEQYKIIGYDRQVPYLCIEIPENERESISNEINNKLSGHKFLVVDESMYEKVSFVPSANSGGDKGWHLSAIKLKEGWTITKGSDSIKVAVVDDGIDPSHPMFKDKIVNAYNVFTQNNHLSAGEGHGTHVASLAVGNDRFFNKGAAGVAPKCMLMPVQVLDNGVATLTSLISGVMYSLNHGAKVINLSVGPSFAELSDKSILAQKDLAENHFKNAEALWNKVGTIAASQNAILVFAAGNDHILTSVDPKNRPNTVIAVTAVNKDVKPSEFSDFGDLSDISAPGTNIYAAYTGGKFISFDGTSMAAPMVTGAIALMKTLDPQITAVQACRVLRRTGLAVNGALPPMLQLDKALEAVKNRDYSDHTPDNAPDNPEDSGTPPVQQNSEISDAVNNAGGNTHGALRFSIMWNDGQTLGIVDLDAHALQPDGNEIYYQQFRAPSRTSMGGQLDVDMINPQSRGVENIYWQDMSRLRDGVYRFWIHNYNGAPNNGCKAEISAGGQVRQFYINRPIYGRQQVGSVTIRGGQVVSIN